ncbi:hypothetical protein AGMMS49960_05340 [Betaproteobacteria bacterium]|nr:hypothetical protein AGMMS49543_05110 [Betaproteobacteria bacterium]GHT99612.1 hypothetical protein AGMMS49960_05340 [Betaproteobacteria bacterium]GHU14035.1 hypothetical protein AGMMS50225_25090 [Betaproteobacteria bacterium]GHU20949.1 hypothetical protein AGMMS50243_17390 [Betaproteobacteria bacterium]
MARKRRLEASQTLNDVGAVTDALKDLLRTPGLEPLRQAFNHWIKALLRRRAELTMRSHKDCNKDCRKAYW